MRKIQKIVNDINDELEGAKHYAESYVEQKAAGNPQLASKFESMASDELRHAMYLHEYAVTEIEKISKVFKAPADMLEKWDEAHKHYVDTAAWIKQMLAM